MKGERWDLWDSVGEILSRRLPYWLRKPKRPALLDPPDFSVKKKDAETRDLFADGER